MAEVQEPAASEGAVGGSGKALISTGSAAGGCEGELRASLGTASDVNKQQTTRTNEATECMSFSWQGIDEKQIRAPRSSLR
jgi:hypothetical protein